VTAARADELANQVLKGQILNALSIFVASAQANINARASLTGSGSAWYQQTSTADPERLRNAYRNIATWCESEAKRMDIIAACVSADPTRSAACFDKNRTP
jgi:hypothetical protein